MVKEHQALLSQKESENARELGKLSSSHQSELDRLDKLLFNEKRESEKKLKEVVKEMNDKHQEEVSGKKRDSMSVF
jgi:hypothetical protein